MKQEIEVKGLYSILETIKQFERPANSLSEQLRIHNEIEILKMEKELTDNNGCPRTESWIREYKNTWKRLFGSEWRRS